MCGKPLLLSTCLKQLSLHGHGRAGSQSSQGKIQEMMVTVMQSPSRTTPSFRQAQYAQPRVESCTTDEEKQYRIAALHSS